MDPGHEQTVLRLWPTEPFPPYAFIPGRHPHPESDPAGHSFGKPRGTPAPLDPTSWTTCREYLRGLDLFNYRFYWESHVEWESLWLACGRQGSVAAFLQGLIRLAAAGVKHAEEKPEGVQSHARRAAQRWREVAQARQEDSLLGFSLAGLICLAETIAQEGWPAPPPLLLPSLPPSGT
jgi:hypothetical protein